MKILLLSAGVYLLSSCYSRNDNAVIIQLTNSLEHSNRYLQNEAATYHAYLEAGALDGRYRDRAILWEEKVRFLNNHVNSLIRYLSEFAKPHPDTIRKQIDEYLQHVAIVVPSFNKTEFLNYKFFDSSSAKIEKLRGKRGSLLIPALKNELLMANLKVLEHCHKESQPSFVGDHVTNFRAVVSIDGKYYKRGDKMELLAGIAHFSRAAAPEILVDSKKIKLTDDAIIHWTGIVNQPPGKYSKKVVINYTNDDGNKHTITKNLEYTVLEECSN